MSAELIQQLRSSVDCHALIRRPDEVVFVFSRAELDRFKAAYERGAQTTLTLPLKLIVYYDYVSPYAYLATRLVEILESEYDIYAEWRGLELRPEWVEFPDWWFQPERSQARWLERHQAVTSFGLPMQASRPAFRPRTRPLLIASEHAKTRGRFREFQRAIYEAYYARGEDIRDLSIVARIGSSVGLDEHELLQAVMERTYEDRIEAWRRQAEADHIFGVPTFKVAETTIWGRVPLDDLRRALEESGAITRPVRE